MEHQKRKRGENWTSEEKIPIPPETVDSPMAGSSLELDLYNLSGGSSRNTNKEMKVIEDMPKNKESNSINVSQNGSEQDYINSHVDFKKKQMKMLEVEHKYNIKVSQLKIKKLELEIALLENENKSITKEPEKEID